MTNDRIIAGLDLGETKVCCVVGRLDELGEVRISGIGTAASMGIRHGCVVDIQQAAQCVCGAVEQAASQAGVAIDSVYVAVSGAHIQTTNSRGVAATSSPDQRITQADIDRAFSQSRTVVVPSDREVIHAIPRMFTVDGQDRIRRPLGMYGARLEVETHIVTGTSTILRNIQTCVETADYEVQEKVLAALASATAVLSPAECDQGVCVLDIGGGTTDIAVYLDGEVTFARVLPLGGSAVTNDIAQVLRVTTSEAERLKLEAGHAVPGDIPDNEPVQVLQIGATHARPLRRRALCEIIEARMKEIFALVQNELDTAKLTPKLRAGFVVTGGGALLSGCVECASSVFQVPVVLKGPRGIGNLAAVGLGAQAQPAWNAAALGGMDHPAFSTAVGLVQRAAAALQQEHREEDGFFAPLLRWLASLRSRR